MEYTGRRQGSECIKTIRVDRKREREREQERERERRQEREEERRQERERRWGIWSPCSLLFSPDGTRILSDSKRGICVQDATNRELISGPLDAEEDNCLQLTYPMRGLSL